MHDKGPSGRNEQAATGDARLSVLMVTYAGDIAEELELALESLAQQSRPAEQVVLVCNGPLKDEQEAVIARWRERLPMTTPRLKSATDLGQALNFGLDYCDCGFIARMDSDDISRPERFARQLDFLVDNREIDVLGSAIDEFDSEPEEVLYRRAVPQTHQAIRRRAVWRNPMNHMTVMYRAEAVRRVGGYRQYKGFEDYELWVRMLAAGCRMANCDEAHVAARVGNGFLVRRSGFNYAISEWRALGAIARSGLYNPLLIFATMPVRFALRCAPAPVLNRIYRVLRKPLQAG